MIDYDTAVVNMHKTSVVVLMLYIILVARYFVPGCYVEGKPGSSAGSSMTFPHLHWNRKIPGLDISLAMAVER